MTKNIENQSCILVKFAEGNEENEGYVGLEEWIQDENLDDNFFTNIEKEPKLVKLIWPQEYQKLDMKSYLNNPEKHDWIRNTEGFVQSRGTWTEMIDKQKRNKKYGIYGCEKSARKNYTKKQYSSDDEEKENEGETSNRKKKRENVQKNHTVPAKKKKTDHLTTVDTDILDEDDELIRAIINKEEKEKSILIDKNKNLEFELEKMKNKETNDHVTLPLIPRENVDLTTLTSPGGDPCSSTDSSNPTNLTPTSRDDADQTTIDPKNCSNSSTQSSNPSNLSLASGENVDLTKSSFINLGGFLNSSTASNNSSAESSSFHTNQMENSVNVNSQLYTDPHNWRSDNHMIQRPQFHSAWTIDNSYCNPQWGQYYNYGITPSSNLNQSSLIQLGSNEQFLVNQSNIFRPYNPSHTVTSGSYEATKSSSEIIEKNSESINHGSNSILLIGESTRPSSSSSFLLKTPQCTKNNEINRVQPSLVNELVQNEIDNVDPNGISSNTNNDEETDQDGEDRQGTNNINNIERNNLIEDVNDNDDDDDDDADEEIDPIGAENNRQLDALNDGRDVNNVIVPNIHEPVPDDIPAQNNRENNNHNNEDAIDEQHPNTPFSHVVDGIEIGDNVDRTNRRVWVHLHGVVYLKQSKLRHLRLDGKQERRNLAKSVSRQLMGMLVPREVLAVHSLTGKKSPAFPNREPLPRIDPRIPEAIYQYIKREIMQNAERADCNAGITAICADAAKVRRRRRDLGI